MQGKSEILDGSRELPFISQMPDRGPYFGSLFQRIIDAVNLTAKNLGSSSVGKLSPPSTIDSITVQGVQQNGVLIAPSEILHWTMTHNSPIKKGIQYITEIATDRNFTAPHIVDHGCSRSGFLHLPTLLNDGKTTQSYYIRSYAQYPGSDPSAPTVFGGFNGPTQIKMTGTSATTLLSSTGSGTASSNGTQGGKGLGVVLDRPAAGPKRNLVV